MVSQKPGLIWIVWVNTGPVIGERIKTWNPPFLNYPTQNKEHCQILTHFKQK